MDRSFNVRKWAVFALVAASLLFLWAQASVAAPGLRLLDRAHLVQERDVIGGEFDLISGPMLYQKHDDASFSRGYRPRFTVSLVGTLRREIYDLPENKAAYGVYHQAVKALQEAGFEAVYQCRQQACGEPEGWHLYLGPLIGGSAQAQHYFLGVAAGGVFMPAPYVAVHVNELEGQSRLLVDYVVPDLSELQKKILPSAALDVSATFPAGSETPGMLDQTALRTMSLRLQKLTSNDWLVLHGHADSDGTLLSNVVLSAHRANAIRRMMIERHGAPPQRLVAWGFGSLVPRQTNQTKAGKAANRRVGIFQLSVE